MANQLNTTQVVQDAEYTNDLLSTTQIVQDIEYGTNLLYVTQVLMEIEYVSAEERVTQVVQDIENVQEGFGGPAGQGGGITSAVQFAEYDGGDIIVTSVSQQAEFADTRLFITSVMQIVEYLSVPPPPPPPGSESTCPPFRIYWQDCVVYARSWMDDNQTAYHELRPFGGPHHIDGAKI